MGKQGGGSTRDGVRIQGWLHLRALTLTSWSCWRDSTLQGCHCAFTDLCGQPKPDEWPDATHSFVCATQPALVRQRGGNTAISTTRDASWSIHQTCQSPGPARARH